VFAMSVDMSRVAALCRKFGVNSLSVFGSFARHEENDDSDIDLLVSFSSRVGLLEIVALERELSEVFGRKVDLQTEGSLSPYIREGIMNDCQTIYAA
jgi:uncharacterized protein